MAFVVPLFVFFLLARLKVKVASFKVGLRIFLVVTLVGVLVITSCVCMVSKMATRSV